MLMHAKQLSQGLAQRKYSINASCYMVPLLAAGAAAVERGRKVTPSCKSIMASCGNCREREVVRIPSLEG